MTAGRKPSCVCGTCRLCIHREQDRQYYLRKTGKVPAQLELSNEQLDRAMTEYFLRKGWDNPDGTDVHIERLRPVVPQGQ